MPALAANTPAPAAAPRVLIVDDSAVARAVLGRMVADGGRFAVAGAVGTVDAALAWLARERADIILLDLAMPGTDALTAIPRLNGAAAGAQVLVVSSTCAQGGAAAERALALGAADTLMKPGGGVASGRFVDALADKLARLARAPRGGSARAAQGGARGFGCVAIGASTGGIHALGHLLRAIPPGFSPPIVVTQHLPASFTPFFAAQLAVLAGRPCDVAVDRLRIRPGRVIVAPGDAHLEAAPTSDGAAVRLSRAAAPSGCLPSVDTMLVSLAGIYRDALLAVVLSGMGRDGLAGAGAVRAAGGTVVVQDEASSAVWGMPGAVAGAGLADAVLSPEAIGRFAAGAGAGAGA